MVVWIGLDEPTPFVQVGLEDDCEDINECEERPGLCGAAGRCLNTQGGHQCECERGYQLTADGTGCVDTRRGICYNKVTAGRYSIVASSVQVTILQLGDNIYFQFHKTNLQSWARNNTAVAT